MLPSSAALDETTSFTGVAVPVVFVSCIARPSVPTLAPVQSVTLNLHRRGAAELERARPVRVDRLELHSSLYSNQTFVPPPALEVPPSPSLTVDASEYTPGAQLCETFNERPVIGVVLPSPHVIRPTIGSAESSAGSCTVNFTVTVFAAHAVPFDCVIAKPLIAGATLLIVTAALWTRTFRMRPPQGPRPGCQRLRPVAHQRRALVDHR